MGPRRHVGGHGGRMISIHPLRGEWDFCFVHRYYNTAGFQSTHSVGSGTHVSLMICHTSPFQSTHSVGSGTIQELRTASAFRFQSTHSVGSGTGKIGDISGAVCISIHPLRGEWDHLTGRRRKKGSEFQSTHSVGSGTSAARCRPWPPRDFNPPTPWEWDELTR